MVCKNEVFFDVKTRSHVSLGVVVFIASILGALAGAFVASQGFSGKLPSPVIQVVDFSEVNQSIANASAEIRRTVCNCEQELASDLRHWNGKYERAFNYEFKWLEGEIENSRCRCGKCKPEELPAPVAKPPRTETDCNPPPKKTPTIPKMKCALIVAVIVKLISLLF